MNYDIFENLNDEQKVRSFEKAIIEMTARLNDIENEPYITFGNKEEQTRLKQNINLFREQRGFALDRLRLGMPTSSLNIQPPTVLAESNVNNSDQIFIASWFHESMEPSIQAIEKGVISAGFKPMCIKHEHFSDRIMDKALGEIRKSKFVVIDLTAARPSVFFEAGFTFGLGLQAIYVYKKSPEQNEALEFYVKHYQCYAYENSEELTERIKDVILARNK